VLAINANKSDRSIRPDDWTISGYAALLIFADWW